MLRAGSDATSAAADELFDLFLQVHDAFSPARPLIEGLPRSALC
jgi:hypothetical protein